MNNNANKVTKDQECVLIFICHNAFRYGVSSSGEYLNNENNAEFDNFT